MSHHLRSALEAGLEHLRPALSAGLSDIRCIARALTAKLRDGTRPSFYVIPLLACLLSAANLPAAMTIQGYDPDKHDRFNNDPSFIGNPYDWSGVGRGITGRWGTMISDTYFLSAAHFAPSGTLRFYHTNDLGGTFEDRAILSGAPIAGSDLWLGKLSTAVSPLVAKYPIFELPTDADYDNRGIFTFGLTGSSPGTVNTVRLGRNQIDPGTIGSYTVSGTTGDAFLFDYDNPGGVGADESKIQPGDSGGPSFALAYGLYPAIVGVHWFNYTDPPNPSGSGDTFVPHYIAALDSAMDEPLMTIPEPSSLALIVIGGAALGVFSRRAGRRSAA